MLDRVYREQPTRTVVLLATMWQCRSQIGEIAIESLLEPPLEPRDDIFRTTFRLMIKRITCVEVSLCDIRYKSLTNVDTHHI
jgi:hypothetical protein